MNAYARLSVSSVAAQRGGFLLGRRLNPHRGSARDVDLLVRPEDLPAVMAALEGAGSRHLRVTLLGQIGARDVLLNVRAAFRIVVAWERIRSDQPQNEIVRTPFPRTP